MTIRIRPCIALQWRSSGPIGLAVLLLLASGVAQAQSIEDRLRNQLRSTAAELTQLRSQLDQSNAEKAAAEQARDAAQAKLAAQSQQLSAVQGQLNGINRNNEALYQQAQTIAAQANQQIAQTKAAYDQLLETARTKEAERAQAVLAVTQLQTQSATCKSKNDRLYELGREILTAYENMDFGSVLASRQPFASKARVELENAAQAYGDRLYEQKFDPRAAGAAPAPAAEPAGADKPAAKTQENQK